MGRWVWRMDGHVVWVGWVGWLAPNSFVSAPGILMIVHQVRLMMFSLKLVDYSMSFLLLSTLNFYWQTRRVDHSETFLLSELFVEPLLHT